MHVELGLTVALPIKMGDASNPILSRLTALMLLTAISRRRVKLRDLVILVGLRKFLPLIPAIQAVLTLPVSVLQAPLRLQPQPQPLHP